MAKITKGYEFGSTELVTNIKLHALIDDGTVTEIVNADVDSAAAIDLSKISGASSSGANSDITSLSGLTTPLSVAQGGTGSATQNFVDNDGTVNPTNLLRNGNFESWSAGASAAPDGWTISSGTKERESTIVKVGDYSLKYTHTSAANAIQNIHEEKGISYLQGRTVTFGCWVYATASGIGRIQIYDGVGVTTSSEHTGDSTWQYLTVTRTISGSADRVTAYLQVLASGTVYFDGAMCVEGASAFAFSPKPAEEGVWADYSAVSTIVGWSSITRKQIFTKKIGKTVFFHFYIYGPSDSTSTSFTLPFTATNAPDYFSGFMYAKNNGTVVTTGANWRMTGGSSTINCYSNTATEGWASSGDKAIRGSGFYESA